MINNTQISSTRFLQKVKPYLPAFLLFSVFFLLSMLSYADISTFQLSDLEGKAKDAGTSIKTICGYIASGTMAIGVLTVIFMYITHSERIKGAIITFFVIVIFFTIAWAIV